MARKEERPDDLEISWDNLQVRILIIAPSILRSTLGLVNKINYPVDLIEVKRWVEGDNQFMLVNKLEEEEKVSKAKPVSGLQNYDEMFYKTQYNSKSAEHFMRYIRQVEKLVHSEVWNGGRSSDYKLRFDFSFDIVTVCHEKPA
ncbi:MAG: hypothetical protein ISS66_20080 [Desulfobacteraceae bacterium]|nr:hypothetical protein [Desulfobacteraceae bacterium]